jgi:hypothetical protein
MPITTYMANKVFDHLLRNQAYTPPSTIYFSLNTADPGDNGANEMAVTRVAGTYSAASSKSVALSSAVVFTNCPTGTVVAFSIWDALSSGNCLWTGFLTASPKAFTGDDSTDVITCPGHGLTTNDQVVFYDDGVGTLPTGVSEATLYYVISSGLTTDAFKISTTLGGSAVNITAKGQGLVSKTTPKTIANAGDTFNLSTATLSLA